MTRSLRRVILILATVLLLSSAVGCANMTPPTPSPEAKALPTGPSAAQPPATPTPTARPTEAPTLTPTPALPSYVIAALKSVGFRSVRAESPAVQAAVPTYSLDPTKARNADLVRRLAPGQRQLLAENGFAIAPDGPMQIYEIYKRAGEDGAPLFVTTDALLHAYHILYDYSLRIIEVEHLSADLKGLCGAMIATTEAQIADVSAVEPLRDAALRNLAYWAVAARLLDPAAPIADTVKPLVEGELALIEAHKGFAASPIFGYDEDYSQYVPRGHYTRNETLQRYFRAMMWLGRIGFRLRPGETPEAIAAGRRETRQALLIVAALQTARVGEESAVAVWERIYEPTVFFVGQADDLNLYDYSQAASALWGERLDLAQLADDAQLDAFIQAAAKQRAPRIVSSLVTDQQNPAIVTQGFRVMGQRFVPDSYILQELVYDKVGVYQAEGEPFTMEASAAGPIRAFPRGLDVAAVLGSERALAILEGEGDAAYDGYPEQMAKLRAEFAALPAEQWSENLYWGWLDTLRPLTATKGEGYPMFMRSPAWADKSLNTFLGSWTELRHDTILYAKQSYTMKATAARPQRPALPQVYVEPELEVWDRLLALVRQTQAGLTDRGLLNNDLTTRYDRMDKLVATLREASRKELTNEALSAEEVAAIGGIGGTLESITTFSDKTQQQVASEADERMAIVADVHTDVNSGQVLEEGVGDPFTIYVLIPQGKDTVIAIGGVFSHYEFKQPMDQRLTDEAWQALETKPPLAPWMGALAKDE